MSERAGAPASRTTTAVDGGVHLVVNEERFPVCGSWRSNWNRTADPARVTCPRCVQRLSKRDRDV